MDEGKPVSIKPLHPFQHDEMEVDGARPFDAVDFIALYRIAEREVFRNPTDQYWGTRLREAQQQVLEPVWRSGATPNLDGRSRQALDLFMCVLEREGKPSAGLRCPTIVNFVVHLSTQTVIAEYREEERRWLKQELQAPQEK